MHYYFLFNIFNFYIDDCGEFISVGKIFTEKLTRLIPSELFLFFFKAECGILGKEGLFTLLLFTIEESETLVLI